MTNVILTGKARYFMAIGEPRDAYKPKPGDPTKDWSFEITVDKEAKKVLKSFGCKNKFNNTEDSKAPMGEVTKFSRGARAKEDGAGWANPYKVVNEYGEPWDPTVAIGNGSAITVLVKMYPREYEGEKFHKAEAVEIMVTELVPYEKTGGGLEYKAKTEEWN